VHLSQAISKLNSLALSNIYSDFISLRPDIDGYNSTELAQIMLRINHEREQLIFARVEFNMNTYILDEHEKCIKCRKKCVLQKISDEFREQYYDVEAKLYKSLGIVQKFINDSASNERYRACKIKCERALKGNISDEERENLLESIRFYNDNIIDTTELMEIISLSINEAIEFHTDGKSNLIHKAKSYYFLKQKLINSECFK